MVMGHNHFLFVKHVVGINIIVGMRIFNIVINLSFLIGLSHGFG